jgi:hypothetical protein
MVFPQYPNARQLFCQSVSARGGGGFIWWTYAVADPPESVVAYYERTLGQSAKIQETPARCWNFKIGHAQMSIYAAADHLCFPNGGEGHAPTDAEQSVLLISS